MAVCLLIYGQYAGLIPFQKAPKVQPVASLPKIGTQDRPHSQQTVQNSFGKLLSQCLSSILTPQKIHNLFPHPHFKQHDRGAVFQHPKSTFAQENGSFGRGGR
jgi:hypothetical protein